MTPVAPTLLPSSNPRVPRAEVPFRHHIDIQIRFTDIDILGHVNNNAYLQMMDLAKLRYFETITRRPVAAGTIRAAVVHIDIDFFEPTTFDEPLQAWSTITRVGTRSFTLQQRIINPSTGATKCIATSVLAGFDPVTQQGAPLEPWLIRAAADFEQRTL